MKPAAATMLMFCAAVTTVAGSEASAQPARRRMERGGITGASTQAAQAGPWYNPSTHAVALTVSGSGGTCGVQSLWVRTEDGKKTGFLMGAATLPGTVGSIFPGPFGLGPGTYEVLVDGAPARTDRSAFEACAGAGKIAGVVVDETVLGQNYPKITGSKWDGPTTDGGKVGIFKVGGPDKILEVTIANYLDGHRWNAPPVDPTAVCAVSIVAAQQGGSGGWQDPFPLVLPNASGSTDVYRGQVITPGPWGAIFKANVTASLSKFLPITAGFNYLVTIQSTPVNNFQGGGASPCIGSTSAIFKAE